MSSRRGGGYGSKKSDPLNKRIPDNPRYSHVKHVVDTGASTNSYLRHLEEIKQNYRYRKDEIFKRLKATTFAQLILQIELFNDSNEEEENITPEPTTPPAGNSPIAEDSPPNTARSTLSSVICGVGEMEVKGFNSFPQVSQTQPTAPPPYLLLDVRDREDYEQAHIITAKHYPPAMLSRSCNNFTKDILEYRNKAGKIIIVYDADERIAPRVATTFIQKEIDNVFLLSGGMKVLHKVFPDCMITGQVPSSCLPSPPHSSRGTASGKRQPLSSSRRQQQQTAIAPVNKIPHVGSRELKETFTLEDLTKIEGCLDTALLSGSSSRASSRSGSSAGASSVASSRASSRSATSTPWKY